MEEDNKKKISTIKIESTILDTVGLLYILRIPNKYLGCTIRPITLRPFKFLNVKRRLSSSSSKQRR